MEHADYVHTAGMGDDEVAEHLNAGRHGVLSLADGDDAYAVPLSYHYDGERLLFRVSTHDAESTKLQFLETTETATFVAYDTTGDDSWSVLVRGAVQRWEDDVDEETLNEWFPPFHLFDESVEDVEFALYELEMDAVTGRKTID